MPQTILQFLNVVSRRVGPLPDVPGLRDPLATIAEIVSAGPDTPETRTLRKVVRAVSTDGGDFDAGEIFTLDRRSMALVAALFEDRVQGRYSDEEWTAGLKRLGV